MVKLKKSEEEKRRFIILQELKIKTNERLEKKDVTWERNINEEIPYEYFNGFSVNKRKKIEKALFLIKSDNIYIIKQKIEILEEKMEYPLRN